jgi:hypothetical protein
VDEIRQQLQRLEAKLDQLTVDVALLREDRAKVRGILIGIAIAGGGSGALIAKVLAG